MDVRVFWSVLAALLIFFIVASGAHLIYVHEQEAEATSALNAVIAEASSFAQAQQASIQATTQARSVQQERARVVDLYRRALIANQRCVGGTVVQVANHSYTQILGFGGRPIKCAGYQAAEYLR